MNEKLFGMLDTVRKSALQAGETASNVAYAVGKQAGAALDTAKLNMQILEKQSAVRDAFRELGEILYATHTGHPSDSDILLEKLQTIDEMKAEIAELEIAAGRASRVHLCPYCGAEVREADRYCRECGREL